MKQCCPSEWGMDGKCWEPLIEVSRFLFITLMPATLMKCKHKTCVNCNTFSHKNLKRHS